MRICLVSREMAPFWGAGIGTYVASMARAWASGGHEVHVLGVNDPEAVSKGPRLFAGVRFHEVDPLSEIDDRVLWRSDVARRAQQVRRTLLRLNAAHRFDYVEFPEYFAEGALAIRGSRTLGELPGVTLGVRLHSPDRLCRELNADPVLGFNRLLTDRLEMESIVGADVVISPTSALLGWCDGAIGALGAAARGHRAVVPYPFDGAEFARSCGLDGAPPALTPTTLDTPPEILYFGRLERRKGVDLLIDAFCDMVASGARCTLRLIGSDTRTGPGATSMREHLVMRLSNEARGRVTFEDRRPRAELGALVRNAAHSGGVCCFPSRWENFPNVVLEAMSLGAPVVCADGSGMAEIVENGRSGLLFRAGDIDSLAGALAGAIGDRSLRERIGPGAIARVAALCDPALVLGATAEAVRRGREGLALRAPSGAGEPVPLLAEVVVDGPSAAREIDQVLRQRGVSGDGCVLLRGTGARVDPRLRECAERLLREDPGVAMVTAHVVGASARESWVPLGLDPSALCGLDLSGIGAGAFVRASALGSIGGVESLRNASGPFARDSSLSWLLGAALASAGLRGVVVPEPWLQCDVMRDPYAIEPSQHRSRMAAAALVGMGGGRATDGICLLASVLKSSR